MNDENVKLRKKIESDLLDQLADGGITGEHFTDMVHKYMTMWDMAAALEKDFRENGVKVLSSTGSKVNPSIPEYAKTNNQMLRLLSEMGLKPTKQEVDTDADY